jgi:hypothetical protein
MMYAVATGTQSSDTADRFFAGLDGPATLHRIKQRTFFMAMPKPFVFGKNEIRFLQTD